MVEWILSQPESQANMTRCMTLNRRTGVLLFYAHALKFWISREVMKNGEQVKLIRTHVN